MVEAFSWADLHHIAPEDKKNGGTEVPPSLVLAKSLGVLANNPTLRPLALVIVRVRHTSGIGRSSRRITLITRRAIGDRYPRRATHVEG